MRNKTYVKNNVCELWDTPDKILTEDILKVLHDPKREWIPLSLLHGSLQDYSEARIVFEALIEKLKMLVEQGDVLIQQKQGISFYRKKEKVFSGADKNFPNVSSLRSVDWRNF